MSMNKFWMQRIAAVSCPALAAIGCVLQEEAVDHGAAVHAIESAQATWVQTIDLSRLTTPSPDPAGITYVPDRNRLLVSDSEVNETVLFDDANLFTVTLSGSLTATGVTTRFSFEPTGASFRAGDRHLFLSDDDADRVFEVDPGADGQHGTSDDRVTSFRTTEFGSKDPEGVAFAPALGDLFVVDGEGRAIYRIKPGANGRFDGASSGDDIVTRHDIGVHGATDPEGIVFRAATQTLLISDRGSRVLEVTTSGDFVRRIDLVGGGSVKGSGIALAPGSNNASATHMYIVDRGVDNDSNPAENDGQIFEFALPDAPTPPAPPPTSGTVIERRVAHRFDDAEEAPNGDINRTSSDLELVTNSGARQQVGLRFSNMTIPNGARVERAYIQFTADETSGTTTSLTLTGQASDNAAAFSATNGDISRRRTTSASTPWSPTGWSSIGESSTRQRTPDLSRIIEEIASRPGWRSGNALAIVITGTGRRVADSFDGLPSGAPLLHVEYSSENPTSATIQTRISTTADDAEETATGRVRLGSSDLEMTEQDDGAQVIGMRFRDIAIPRGATIDSASIQFQTDEVDRNATTLEVRAQAADNASPFTTGSRNVSQRPTTSARVGWSPPAWPTVGAAGADQRTPDLTSLVQEVTNRTGWRSGNALVFIVRGSGKRTAESFDGTPAAAPALRITYRPR